MTEFRIYDQVGYVEKFLANLLVKKILPQDKQVTIVVDSNSAAKKIDEALWKLPNQLAFVPHCLASDKEAGRTPVIISVSETEFPRDVLIVIGPIIPDTTASHDDFVAILPNSVDDESEFSDQISSFHEKGHSVTHYCRNNKA